MDFGTAARFAVAGLLGCVWNACANPRGPSAVSPVRTASPSGSASSPSLAAPHHRHVIRREAWLMGTSLRVTAAAESRAAAAGAVEAAFRAVEDVERELSSWREDSDLGRLRRAPAGAPVPVTPRTAALLAEAAVWAERTGGAFDPAVGPLVDAWDLRGAGRVPSDAERADARAATGLARVRISEHPPSVTRLHPAAWLDAGGFGKGAALREAAGALRAGGAEAALLDFGGQLLALGDDPEGSGPGWPVALAHPSRRDSALLRGRLLRGSLATSGASERAVEAGGERFGHVLDPRTGRPAPAWGSVTVAADDPLAADALATALFVMGPADGVGWLAEGGADAGAVFLVETDSGVEVLRAGVLDGRLSVQSAPETGAAGAAGAEAFTRDRRRRATEP